VGVADYLGSRGELVPGLNPTTQLLPAAPPQDTAVLTYDSVLSITMAAIAAIDDGLAAVERGTLQPEALSSVFPAVSFRGLSGDVAFEHGARRGLAVEILSVKTDATHASGAGPTAVTNISGIMWSIDTGDSGDQGESKAADGTGSASGDGDPPRTYPPDAFRASVRSVSPVGIWTATVTTVTVSFLAIAAATASVVRKDNGGACAFAISLATSAVLVSVGSLLWGVPQVQ
jgi:hypothetical protein